jgi:hypothetical protein
VAANQEEDRETTDEQGGIGDNRPHPSESGLPGA